jgi:hypothetical protein
MEVTSALTVTPHPLTLDGQKHIAYDLVPGETLGAFLRRHVDNMDSGAWIVTIGGYEVPAALWEKTFPKHGTIIECRSVVQKQAVALIAIVALSMFAPYLAGAAYGAMGGTFVAANAAGIVGAMSVGITVAGSLIINKVLGPKQADAGSMRDSQASPTYSLSGGRNRARQFEPIGMLFGELRCTPDFAGRPYTWFDGDDQWLYSVFHAGINVSTVSDIRIGQTPIDNYSDVYARASGIPGMDSYPLELWSNVDAIEGAVLAGGTTTPLSEVPDGFGGWTIIPAYTTPGPWLTRTSSANALVLSADFEGSLYRVSDKGAILAQGMSIEGEYRQLPGGAWVSFLPANGGVIENATTKPVRRTFTKEVPLGQYEVRFRKVDPDSESSTLASKLFWSQLKTIQNDSGTYGNMGRLGLRIKASGQISGALDEVNWMATAKPIPYWNGTSWVTATSRVNGLSNPGAQFLQFARGIYDTNGKLIAGLGLQDSQIDIEALQGFMVWCASIGASFDYYMDSPTSCQDILDSIAAVGMGSVTWQSGKLGVSWASNLQPIQGVANMATMKAKTFSVSYQTLDTADSLEYAYYDRLRDFTWQTLRVTDPTTGTALNPARISSIGVTGENHAALLARFHLAQSIYQRKEITFDTDLEHLTYKRMSVLALTHDVTQWGYGGRLDAVTNNAGILTLTLDDEVPAGSGARYIGLRVPGEVGYRVFGVNAFSGSSRTITLSTAWPGGVPVPGATTGNPACDTIWIYDFKATPGYKVRVVGIQPQTGLMGATVTVVPESDAFWNYVLYGAYTSPASGTLLSNALPVASNIRMTEELQRQGNTFAIDVTGTFDIAGNFDHAQVWVSTNGGDLAQIPPVSTSSFTLRAQTADVLHIEVRPFDALGRAGSIAYADYQVSGLGIPPADVPWFSIEGNTLTWGTVADADLAGYRIRYNYGQKTSWGDANALHEGVVTQSPYTPAVMPSGQLTLMIKAVDTSGNESGNAALIRTVLGDQIVANVVETTDYQAQGYPGIVTGGAASGGALRATSIATFFGADAADFYSEFATAPFFVDNFAALTYETPIYTPSRTTLAGSKLTLLAAISGDSINIEYRTSGQNTMFPGLDTEPFYGANGDYFYEPPGAWQPWPGQITSQYLQYQFRISIGQSVNQGVIGVCKLLNDVPDITERLNDIVISASGTRLPLAKTYSTIANVQLTLQADGGTAAKVEIGDKLASGPMIYCRNAAGSQVSGKIDAIVQGY